MSADPRMISNITWVPASKNAYLARLPDCEMEWESVDANGMEDAACKFADSWMAKQWHDKFDGEVEVWSVSDFPCSGPIIARFRIRTQNVVLGLMSYDTTPRIR